MIYLSDSQPLSISKIKNFSSTTTVLQKIFSDKVHAILIKEVPVQTTLRDGASYRRLGSIIILRTKIFTSALKLTSSLYCALWRVCLRLLFLFSCKTSQNVAFCIYLHEVNSKFHVNRHYRCEALCFILSHISLDENFYGCKNQ